jgi:hypothetical protein
MTMSSDGDELSYFHSHKRKFHARAAARKLSKPFPCRKIHSGKISARAEAHHAQNHPLMLVIFLRA